MGTERTDLARGISDRFYKDLQALESGSYDAYRAFVTQFWPVEEDREFALDAITMAEMAEENLTEWRPFQIYFKWKSFRQFSKCISQFRDEDIKLGFMSR